MKPIHICILLLALFLPGRIDAQHIYFSAIGVGDYPGWKNDLIVPAHDAEDMYDLYNTTTEVSSVLFTDSSAKKKRILSETTKLFSKAGKNDIVILFFSGHGYPGGFVAHDDYLTYGEIRQLFSGCKAKNKMIFADACFSGDLRDNSGGGFKDSNNDIMLFLSSRDNEYSIENPKLRNGYFTTCLLRSLKGGADMNLDRTITARELFLAVSSGVAKLSQNKQHPVMWGNFDNDMPVMIWK